MTISDLRQQIMDGSKKALLTAAISGAASAFFLGGTETASVFGNQVPRFIISSATMGVASLSTDLLMPKIVPYISKGNPTLIKFNLTVIEPLLVGVASVVVDSVISPQAIAEMGGDAKSVVNGAGSSILSYYILDKMALINQA